MMQLHLDEISLNVADGAHAILLLDRAGWHTTGKLDVPDNITPIFLPSRAPELNPVENIWQYLRRTGSQTLSLKTTTRSSTPHAPLGESSSLNPKPSRPSECATGLTSVSRCDRWYKPSCPMRAPLLAVRLEQGQASPMRRGTTRAVPDRGESRTLCDRHQTVERVSDSINYPDRQPWRRSAPWSHRTSAYAAADEPAIFSQRHVAVPHAVDCVDVGQRQRSMPSASREWKFIPVKRHVFVERPDRPLADGWRCTALTSSSRTRSPPSCRRTNCRRSSYCR